MEKFNTQVPFFQRFRVLCLIAVALTLAACSSVRFAYNQGDTLLYWWLDAYVDMDSEQKGAVERGWRCRRGAQTTCANDQNSRIKEFLLTFDAYFRQQNVAAVAQQLAIVHASYLNSRRSLGVSS